MRVRTGSELHQEAYDHILKLLSATVNASLAELGHFPGSGVILQELRQQNQQFRDLTTKLHEDNVTLQRIADGQKRDIAALQCGNLTLQRQIESLVGERRQLDEDLRKVVIERDNLVSYTRVCALVHLIRGVSTFTQ